MTSNRINKMSAAKRSWGQDSDTGPVGRCENENENESECESSGQS